MRTFFGDSGLYFCNVLFKTNNSDCSAILFCLVSKLQKAPPPGIKLGQVFRICGLCCCNFFAETNNFSSCTVLLFCLISNLQKLPCLGTECRTLFLEFGYCCILFVSSWNKHANFGANQYIWFLSLCT